MLKHFGFGQHQALTAGTTLENRYHILRELGQGGFGRTYLAEDRMRFNEQCVIKEFAPQVRGTKALQKAEELFAREAGVLYQLQHPQIPRFECLIRAKVGGSSALFLVQDYIEGQTYSQLLESRQQQGQRFSEIEIRQLLREILPVLDYIHTKGLIHRDISPDNLIRRQSDGLTFLIDFGAVKQVATTAIHQLTPLRAGPTQIRKPGYSPEEQKQGQAYPSSDLYALAVTIVVLLTGEKPQALQDTYNGSWRWQQKINVSPNLTTVLNKMLAHQPGDRYPSATEVYQALNLQMAVAAAVPQLRSVAPPQPPTAIIPQPVASPSHVSQMATVNVVGRKPLPIQPIPVQAHLTPANPQAVATPAKPKIFAALFHWPLKLFWQLVRTLLKIGSLGLLLAVLGYYVAPKIPRLVAEKVKPPTALTEQQRRDRFISGYGELEVAEDFWIRWVNELFYEQNPNIKGRTLTDNPEDTKFRDSWNDIAEDVLNRVKQANISLESRQKLGRYTKADYERWEQSLDKAKLSQLNKQTNEVFYELFPEQQGKALNEATSAQIWYAIANDRFKALN